MSVRKKQVIVTTFYIVGVSFMLLGIRRSTGPVWGISLAVNLGGVLLMAVLYRCPHCGRYLGGNFQIGKRCPRCGEKIE